MRNLIRIGIGLLFVAAAAGCGEGPAGVTTTTPASIPSPTGKLTEHIYDQCVKSDAIDALSQHLRRSSDALIVASVASLGESTGFDIVADETIVNASVFTQVTLKDATNIGGLGKSESISTVWVSGGTTPALDTFTNGFSGVSPDSRAILALTRVPGIDGYIIRESFEVIQGDRVAFDGNCYAAGRLEAQVFTGEVSSFNGRASREQLTGFSVSLTDIRAKIVS